jgi:hypothetical protein
VQEAVYWNLSLQATSAVTGKKQGFGLKTGAECLIWLNCVRINHFKYNELDGKSIAFPVQAVTGSLSSENRVDLAAIRLETLT